MIRKFICKDGAVFAKSTSFDASVDEVIDFLEQYRGMRFWNGAAGDVAFRLDGGTICCDSADFTLEQAYTKSKNIGEQLEAFFDGNDVEIGTEEPNA